MGLKCLFGHKWNGCKCLKCGKSRLHVWNGCVCVNCGKENHTWNDCKCIMCGETRVNSYFGYCKMQSVPGKCQKQCSICGVVADNHVWNGCICEKCGKIRFLPIPERMPVYGTKGSIIMYRSGELSDTSHKGPWEKDPANPCVIVCKSCGQKAWEHTYESKSGMVGTSPGGGATIDFGSYEKCIVCGAVFGARAKMWGTNGQEGYYEE